MPEAVGPGEAPRWPQTLLSTTGTSLPDPKALRACSASADIPGTRLLRAWVASQELPCETGSDGANTERKAVPGRRRSNLDYMPAAKAAQEPSMTAATLGRGGPDTPKVPGSGARGPPSSPPGALFQSLTGRRRRCNIGRIARLPCEPTPCPHSISSRRGRCWGIPGLDWDTTTRANLAEQVAAAATVHEDVFVVYRDDLPEGEPPARALADGFGAESGDEVVEVRPGPKPGELTARRWKVA